MREFVERRTADGVADAAARRRRGARAGADAARHASSARRTARSTPRSTRARYVRAFAQAAQRRGATDPRGHGGPGHRARRVADHRGSRPTSGLSAGTGRPGRRRLVARTSADSSGSSCRSARCASRSSRRSRCRRAWSTSCTARRRSSSTPSSRELPSFRAGAFATDARGPRRPGAPRVGVPGGGRVVPPGHRDGLPGLRLEAGSRRRRARHRGHAGRAARSCAAPRSPGRGPASCRSRRDNLPIIDRVPGFDDLIVAAGHVFGNGAGTDDRSARRRSVCGDEPVIDLTPFRPTARASDGLTARVSGRAKETPVERRIAFINPFGTAAYDAIIEETLIPYAATGTAVEVIHLEGVPGQHRLLLPEAPHGDGDLRQGARARGAPVTTPSSSAAATTRACASPASSSTSRSSARSRRR